MRGTRTEYCEVKESELRSKTRQFHVIVDNYSPDIDDDGSNL